MKAHNLEALGYLKLSYTPVNPDHAIRLQDIESLGGGGHHPVFATNVEPTSTGNVGSKQYSVTVPINQVLQSCLTDTQNVRIHFLADGGSAYNPTITIDGGPVDSITEVPGNKRLFQGYKDIVVTESRDVTISSSTGSSTIVTVNVAAAGPDVSTALIDSIPLGQTAVKSGDIISVSGTVDNTATSIEVQNSGIASSGSLAIGAVDSGGPGLKTFSGTITVSGRSGTLSYDLIASNQLGTPGNLFSSTDTALLDQTYPVINVGVVNDNGETALGLNDTATVTISITDQDSQTFSFAHGDEGGDVNTYLTNRTITVTASIYSISGGLTTTATRSSNGASTSVNTTVKVSSILPSASITVVGVPIEVASNDIPEFPRVGVAPVNVNTDAEIELYTTETVSTNNQQITIACDGTQWGFLVYPKAMGTASFVDTSSGFPGGWDGATWPEDGSVGTEFTPIEITRNGIVYYVYRTDFRGVNSTFDVTFTNPGLTVGPTGDVATLLSSETGSTYNVRITASQQIDVAPSLNISKGTWTGGWTQYNATTWQRSLTVQDSDVGIGQFSNLILTSLSGEVQASISSGSWYQIKGFAQRVINIPALSQIAAIGATVSDSSKVIAYYGGFVDPLLFRTDKNDVSNSFTIVDSGGNVVATGGTHIWLNDVAYAGSNTSGALTVEIEETL